MPEEVNVNLNLNLSINGEFAVHHYHHHSNPSQPGAADILNAIRDSKEAIMTQLDTSTAKETQDSAALIAAVEQLSAAFTALQSQNNSGLQAALDAANLDSATQATILDANDAAIQAELAKVQALLPGPATPPASPPPPPTDTTGAGTGNDTVAAGGATDTTGAGGGVDTIGAGGGTDTVGHLVLGVTSFTGAIGQAFTGDPQINGGTAPYSVTSTPPSDNGLSVGPNGQITGTPVAAGTSTFSYAVSDSSSPALNTSASVEVVVPEAVQAV